MVLEAKQCKWFALCQHPAVSVLPHPVLGEVPVCDRCIDMTMRITNFVDFDGSYTMPLILYRLLHDFNEFIDKDFQLPDPSQLDEAWHLPVGELLAIEGTWTDEGYGLGGDADAPNWTSFGIDQYLFAGNPEIGVHYVDNYMVIVGDNDKYRVFWIFKKA